VVRREDPPRRPVPFVPVPMEPELPPLGALVWAGAILWPPLAIVAVPKGLARKVPERMDWVRIEADGMSLSLGLPFVSAPPVAASKPQTLQKPSWMTPLHPIWLQRI